MSLRRRVISGCLVVGCLAVSVLVSAGCSGRASVHMIPLGSKKLKTTGPLLVQIEPERCYYWVTDDGNLCVSMSDFKGSLISSLLEREFYMSLVLEGLPAGSARTYQVDRRTARLRARSGLGNIRSASLNGVVTVWDYGQKKLRGRFRLVAKQQSYFVLTGWGGNKRVLLVGEFTAVPSQDAGERILARTEEGSMRRAAVSRRPKPRRVQGPSPTP